jgi:hypothetical protein
MPIISYIIHPAAERINAGRVWIFPNKAGLCAGETFETQAG